MHDGQQLLVKRVVGSKLLAEVGEREAHFLVLERGQFCPTRGAHGGAPLELPRIDGRAWGGNGTGNKVCACCGETIGRLDREFEPQAVAGLYAHGPCFNLARGVPRPALYDRHPDGRQRRDRP